MQTEGPDLVIAKLLLDHLKLRGFQFQRAAPGVDGPLVGNRVTGDWVDAIHIEGFSRDCFAWRKRTSSLIVPGEDLWDAGCTATRSPFSSGRGPSSPTRAPTVPPVDNS
ncbi:MAG: hypothetical protein DLM61_00880 [Pseudonocardiales bacterium]|nr:hypothetical protein [Pseudonocardiales bacterium]PZS36063.1 MAG: hypothetical protein DLM61_00880 [Pseudonocardiales bacterium]